ncbi:MAG: hypothetical protein C0594_11285 [Marinilabiliales bacterium]|nr:MAG: hypothetical protein C0594_11285 [Marinilabiliales bacterium]
MHILIIPSWYKTSTEKSLGTFFFEQAVMLKKMGHKVGIIYPYHVPSTKAKSPNEKTIIDSGIPTFYSCTSNKVPTRIGDVVNKAIVLKNFYNEFQNYTTTHGSPDVVHAHSVFYAGLCAQHIQEKCAIPYVLTEHFSGLSRNLEYLKFPYRDIIMNCYEKSNKNIFVSKFLHEQIINRFEIKSGVIIPNLVNPIFFNNLHHKEIKKQINILNIGALNKLKNQKNLLQAIKQASKESGLQFSVTIIGKGKEKKNLKELAKKIKLKKFNIIEEASRKEIKKLIDNTHILVSTSIYETFGLNIAEAHAAGKPTVVFNSGGPAEFVNKSNGILVEYDNPESIADAILSVINNYDNYNPQEISESCKNRFSEDVIYSELIKIYNKVLK